MRLLLCEDEVSLSDGLVAILKRNNYSVDAVYDGREALDYIASYDYDAIILDIMMPKVDGLGVLKHIRGAGNQVPVIMLTAKSELDDKVIGFDSGADDYLTKPFATKELIVRIRALTRRQTASLDTKLIFGNISLNRSNYELSNGTQSFRLSNKEYQMMEMMMANPEQIFSTDRFMDRIWGYDSDAEINVVWVQISYLRKKLSTLNANFNIVSSRNLGYSLKVK